MKKKSTLLTEAIARAEQKKYEERQKANVVVQMVKRNDDNLRNARQMYFNK
jgi:hypothetical protein